MPYTIITGASGDIGRSTANYLCDKGYNLILVDITELSQLENNLKSKGCIVVCRKLDITDQESVLSFSNLLISNKFEIRGLINLAGITKDRTIAKMSLDDWNKVLTVNLTGTFLMLKEISELMKEKGGSIVNIGSTSARHGNFGQANYVASKSGIEGLTKTAARELAKYDIRVNCVIPGFISTKMTDQIPTKYRKQVVDQIPLNRAGLPLDVAKAIEFLLSSSSSYITGANIKVDGGLRIN